MIEEEKSTTISVQKDFEAKQEVIREQEKEIGEKTTKIEELKKLLQDEEKNVVDAEEKLKASTVRCEALSDKVDFLDKRLVQ